MPPAFDLSTALSGSGCVVRAETMDDVSFLSALYASTRADEMAQVAWPSEEQKQAFLEQQFNAQRTHYRNSFPDCAFYLIECEGTPIGRLYLDLREDRLHIVDIALLPIARGRGLGTALLDKVIATAATRGLGVGLHVERFNPASRLYSRLGFREVADGPVYLQMARDPDDAGSLPLS